MVLSACTHIVVEHEQLGSGPVFVQISDLHFSKPDTLYNEMIDEINKLNPDVLFLTGDIVESEKGYDLMSFYLKMINLEIRKFAVPGNWDSPPGVDTEEYRIVLLKAGVTLLVNEQTEFNIEDRKIIIYGIDDLLFGQPDFSGFSPREDALNIVLGHCPQLFDTLHDQFSDFRHPVYMLSGHTHGGQITFFGLPLYTPDGSGRFTKGFYSKDNFILYVNRGTGTSTINLRIFSSPEITVFNSQTAD